MWEGNQEIIPNAKGIMGGFRRLSPLVRGHRHVRCGQARPSFTIPASFTGLQNSPRLAPPLIPQREPDPSHQTQPLLSCKAVLWDPC